MNNSAVKFFASRYSVKGGERARFLFAVRELKGAVPAPTFEEEKDYVLYAAQEAAARGDLKAAAFELAFGAYGAGGEMEERMSYFEKELGIAA